MMESIKSVQEHGTARRYRATVLSSERITPEASDEEVRELVLEVDRGDFPYKVGQSIGVVAPGQAELGQKEHYRLYSVADLPDTSESGKPRIKIAVRRCYYIDDYSGERYPGVASNYLCDLAPGAEITLTGPFGLAFEIPAEPDANLVLIGTSTGIAPFRAFVKHLHRNVPGWQGRIWLFYGAKSGLEMLYMNDEKDDFQQYYDKETFEAFRALSPRPNWADPIAWDQAIKDRGDELWRMLGDPKTYVYVAGLEQMSAELDKIFAKLAESPEKWKRRKAELVAGKRWVELLY